ncbi:putative Transcriptional regulatory protein AruR [Rubrivivax sp. A210]|uniref:response regulator transcription factor n=1 Tax=Rubrivivax sp. A210 TaxID=2772301 RepID=UPI001919C8B2|nr:response regulator transcription factor [Rubrivivax sp. A210]CAD5367382.1 putative Transcriptional regulatory protein AruR [Rubrivivax sp. A210]
MSPTSCPVCIVEDEAVLREEMAFQLRHHGYRVETFESAAGFYRHLAVQPRLVAVLDIGLEGEDGLAICQYLRQHRLDIGIIFVTARALRDDRLEGLAAGADAYLVKPVDMDELVLLIERLSLRFAAASAVAVPPPLPKAGGWHLDAQSLLLIAPRGDTVRLSMAEFQVVRRLLERPGEHCSHAEIATAMGLLPEEWDKHRVEVVVSRLRAKVARELTLSLPIRSVRGIGYAMASDERRMPRRL